MVTQNIQTAYLIYVPINDNDGRRFVPRRLRRAMDKIGRLNGGYTCFPLSDGIWITADGRICRDRVLPILVVATRGVKTERAVARIAGELAHLLAQEEIFIVSMPVATVSTLAEGSQVFRNQVLRNHSPRNLVSNGT